MLFRSMAFLRGELLALGGFDPQFRQAGDDIDICWRLLDAGKKIGYAAGAMVWHHRRDCVRSYFKQQWGYGRSEAMVHFKHPRRFDSLGRSRWKGVIYGDGAVGLPMLPPLIYQGRLGSAPFQTIYRQNRYHVMWVAEANRSDQSRSANRYLKRIRYGNRTPYLPDLVSTTPPPLPIDMLFEVVFDYGEHDTAMPHPVEETQPWSARHDPFSTHRSAFEIRTHRLCRRVLMFHHVAEDADLGDNCLVRSTDLVYREPMDVDDGTQPGFTQLIAVEQRAYQRRSDGRYDSRQVPPVTFRYSEAHIDATLRSIDASQLDNLPVGTQGPGYQWIDVDGEGLPGVLSEQLGAWYYKPNLGDGRFPVMRG